MEWMKEKGIRDVYDVGEVVQEYYRNSEALLDKIESESLEEG